VPRDVTTALAGLANTPFTYEEVGSTRDSTLPAGYDHILRDARLGTGRAVFERAADQLFSWRVHQRAGLAVVSSGAKASAGIVVILRAGWGPFHITIPCRVVYTVNEADRRGFAYGTLPGHPECGEEAFTVLLTETGDVRIRIRAFSRPASLLARMGGPVTRMIARFVAARYVTALRQLASER
jgi:uncharacterized protein (UPF0548 family)